VFTPLRGSLFLFLHFCVIEFGLIFDLEHHNTLRKFRDKIGLILFGVVLKTVVHLKLPRAGRNHFSLSRSKIPAKIRSWSDWNFVTG
jgi:hypothetical protein